MSHRCRALMEMVQMQQNHGFCSQGHYFCTWHAPLVETQCILWADRFSTHLCLSRGPATHGCRDTGPVLQRRFVFFHLHHFHQIVHSQWRNRPFFNASPRANDATDGDGNKRVVMRQSSSFERCRSRRAECSRCGAKCTGAEVLSEVTVA